LIRLNKAWMMCGDVWMHVCMVFDCAWC